jgi:hypothetical protein
MAKEKVSIEEVAQPDAIEQGGGEGKAINPIADIIKSIGALQQVDRLVLYNRLDIIINHDREKASAGADGGTHLFDEAIKSL